MSTEVPSAAEASEGLHEQVWPEWVYPYPAGIIGGLLGAAAVALVGIGYCLITPTVGIWLPVNVVAATLLRDLQAQSTQVLSQFNFLALVVGLAIHVTISIGLGEVFSFILPALPGRPLYWGPVIGPLLWVGATFAVLPILNPRMAADVEWVSFGLANVLYGLILGWWIDRTPLVHVER